MIPTGNSQTRVGLLPLVMIAGLVCFVPAGQAATFTLTILDGPGEGFNDPTPVAPVGGNTGTTLGDQRFIVLQRAAEIWGSLLPSTVDIRVQAAFDPRPCDSLGAVLASAGALSVSSDFSGALVPNTWYQAALANKLAGMDLNPGGDDITIGFNVNIDDNDACLVATNWYYGLDGNEGTDIELLATALHELGHGLGFSSFTDPNSGGFLLNTPDIYARQLFDNSTGLRWDEMRNNERKASTVNFGNVVWDGASVTSRAPSVLSGRPRLLINSPPSIAGSYQVGTATFGAELTETGVTGDVVLVDDGVGTTSDACEPIVNPSELIGKVALIDRGICTFVSKALAAQAEGAIAVIIVDNQITSTPPLMGGTDPAVTIPIVSVTNAVGSDIKSELASGVNVTLDLDPTLLAGADDAGRVLIYTPNPLEPGSSISHWDFTATPDLLMEPFIGEDISGDVDLTLDAFEDIGWLSGTVDVLAESPSILRLRGGFPNPFVTLTSIRFDLEREQDIELSIYDVTGRHVKRLVAGTLARGQHAITWDGTDEGGQRLTSGVYFSVLQTDNKKQARQLVILR